MLEKIKCIFKFFSLSLSRQGDPYKDKMFAGKTPRIYESFGFFDK